MTTLFIFLMLIPMLVVWLFLLFPLYLIAKKRGITKNKKTFALLMCSPMMVMGGLLIAFLIYAEIWGGPKPQSRDMDKDRIERITKVRLPDFEMTDFKQESAGFLPDYDNTYTIEFKEELTDEFHAKLDSLVNEGVWGKYDDGYGYSTSWGNGRPAPEGENEEEHRFYRIRIVKGSKTATITAGVW